MDKVKPGKLKIKVSKSLQAKIAKGHPWVHFYQLQNRDVVGKPGDLGVIYDFKNRFLAIGLFDPFSDIRLRILNTGEPVSIDGEFFTRRLEQALLLRRSLEGTQTTGYRLVNGENDGFPGLVVDRYGETFVIKLYTEAWAPHLDLFVESLKKVSECNRIVLLLSRHVERTRTTGPANGHILYGPPLDGPVHFTENSLVFQADVVEGQKTGFYFDQRENRARLKEIAEGKEVLNVFSYTGGFSVYCMLGKARSVTEVDINQQALLAAKENMLMNFPERALNESDFNQIHGDAFKVLSEFKRQKRQFDLVILDPPAFASRNEHKSNALQAYLRLAKAGAQCTRPGGLLFAASCSQSVGAKDFFRSVSLGIRQTGRKEKALFKSRHGVDHPISFQGGEYLKAGCFEVF